MVINVEGATFLGRYRALKMNLSERKGLMTWLRDNNTHVNKPKAEMQTKNEQEASVQLGEEAFAYFCEWVGCLYPSRKVKYHGIWFVRNELIGKRSIIGTSQKGTELVRQLEESFNRHGTAKR